ncbi:argininosuccinate synthase [Peptoniphilus catoniae]|uniref:argininosuccinate synthase n=1 Tax=Peptoniphilus catoniae TaxID=1660341 RepID=UPI0010FD87C0|nr:argininosuccinate synthase [Peptoniphilus catoniae]
MTEVKKVVLAYSGGLDTSVMISWLIENYGCEVIAVAADLGQGSELCGLEEKAKKTGASKVYISDLKNKFVEDFVFETIKSGAKYENNYLLGTAFARPIIAEEMVRIAHKEGADAIVHGCTGKGNDQIRFETAIRHFDPYIKILAPWRYWELKSREDEEAYAASHNIKINSNKGRVYSEDRNLFHISHEGLDLEDPINEPDYSKVLSICKTYEEASNEAEYIELEFKEGIAVKLNGEELKPVDMLAKLNEIGANHAIGIDDIIEDRIVGIKVRGIYENSGGAILYKGHEILESLTMDRDMINYKATVAIKYANLIYEGLWHSKLRQALGAFVDFTQKNVNGKVRLKLYKGNIIPAGVSSDYSLFNKDFATFGEDSVYNQEDSQGFVNLFSLPSKIQTIMEEKTK